MAFAEHNTLTDRPHAVRTTRATRVRRLLVSLQGKRLPGAGSSDLLSVGSGGRKSRLKIQVRSCTFSAPRQRLLSRQQAVALARGPAEWPPCGIRERLLGTTKGTGAAVNRLQLPLIADPHRAGP